MMKAKLEKMLAEKQEQRKSLVCALVDGETTEARRATQSAIDALDSEMSEIRSMIEACGVPAQQEKGIDLSKVATGVRMGEDADMEYRKAFKNFIATGAREELRAAGNTTNADNVGSVIPENLLGQIMKKIEHVGTIYNLVSKTAYPVGQTIAKEGLRPTATWVGAATGGSGEGLGSNVGKGATIETTISFTHFKLRCEVAMSEEVATMALPAFEALFVENVSVAMLRAIEFAIVDGTGSGMPTGILKAAVPTGQAISVVAEDNLSYQLLCDAEAALPAEHEAGAKWCMTKKTFMKFVGMVDQQGQPIARVNYGIAGKPERTLLGREVVIYVPQNGSVLGNYADAVEADTIFAFMFDFSDYTLNTNYNLGIQHKIDWDNEDHRTKAVGAYDGKVVDNGSLVVLKKTVA